MKTRCGLAIGCLLLLAMSAAAAARVVSLPDDATGNIGEQVMVPLSIDDATGLLSVTVRIEYDPDVLLATDVSLTPLTDGSSLTANLTPPGTLRFNFFRIEKLSSGAGPLVEIQFNVEGSGLTALRIVECLLEGEDENGDETQFPCTPDDGQFITEGFEPVGPADPFLGYKIKVSKGSFCSEDAPMQVGGSCKGEEDCGGIEGDTAFCVPNKFPKGLQVTLVDQFEEGIFDVKKPVGLYNPANVDGVDVNNPDTHLQGYLIQLASNVCTEGAPANIGETCQREEECGGARRITDFCVPQAKHDKQVNIRVDNQFGQIVVDTIKPDRLLVPTAKDLDAPVPPLADPQVDHFKCYTVKVTRGTDRFVPIPDVSVVDQFDQLHVYTLQKPTRLCTPVDKNGEGILDPDTHLLCYQVQQDKDAPKHVQVTGIFVNNQFGPAQLDTIKEEEICVPSVKTLP
jgi:hypothetical protein